MKNSKLIIFPLILLSFGSFANNSYYFKINNELTKNIVIIESEETSPPEIVMPDWIAVGLDDCDGMRQSSAAHDVYYARADTNMQNLSLPIPNGYHWSTVEEYKSRIPSSTGDANYYGQCGLPAYPYINGAMQYFFIFSDTSNGHLSSAHYEGMVFSGVPHIDKFAGYVLIKD